jgi:hypothetical protein
MLETFKTIFLFKSIQKILFCDTVEETRRQGYRRSHQASEISLSSGTGKCHYMIFSLEIGKEGLPPISTPISEGQEPGKERRSKHVQIQTHFIRIQTLSKRIFSIEWLQSCGLNAIVSSIQALRDCRNASHKPISRDSGESNANELSVHKCAPLSRLSGSSKAMGLCA